MIFYMGTHKAAWLARTEVPLFAGVYWKKANAAGAIAGIVVPRRSV